MLGTWPGHLDQQSDESLCGNLNKEQQNLLLRRTLPVHLPQGKQLAASDAPQ
jgi:hypothetical protein